jgi:type II secretory ATPase GspE/PulE/Tfp pilus assembly ATPase PilB-like protein/ActR/RegA family two-component response regulator
VPADTPQQHWLVDVARRAKLPDADRLDIPSSTPIKEAWSAVARICRIGEPELAVVVATRFRINVARLDAAEPRALKLVPESVARRFTVLPLRETDRNIFIATSTPLDLDAEQAVAFAAGRTPVFEIASPSPLTDAIESLYNPDRIVEALLGPTDVDLANAVAIVDEPDAEEINSTELTAAPVVKLTNYLLQEAVRERASDVHIEPSGGGGIVRLRVDGVLRTQMQLPAAAFVRVVSRIKVLAKMNIADRMRPQDGRARVRIDNKSFDLRISTVPVREREKVVIRILDPEGSPVLSKLGMPEYELARIRQLTGFREGVVIVTGPTGSGKTTTMYGALRQLATGAINIMTVEDPVEYELPGITQIQVETKRDVTFASSLRAILRQDPDVVFVGEIRDSETAEIAVQASMTGHLVLATLHTNDAVGTIPRLIDLGLSPVSIAASFRGVVAQRLIRRACTHCRELIGPNDVLNTHERELAARYNVRPTVRAVGCKHCGSTGYRGRMALAEVLVATPTFLDAVAHSAAPSVLQQLAVTGGMRPIREVALDAVRAAETTIDEVERVVGEVAAPPAPDKPASAVPQVLLVDDDPIIRRLACALLEKIPVKVSEADDGPVALAMIEAGNDFSLMILDLDMPSMAGHDVLVRLRSNPATAAMPVIVLTGSEAREDEAALMDAGADDYIKKPIDPTRFVARVRAVLRRMGG